jgi:Ca-activated chloride channel family protein
VTILAGAICFIAAGSTPGQTDRPPWARKQKTKAAGNSDSTTNSTSAGESAGPVGEPGKTVEPIPAASSEVQEPGTQRGKISVNVNLVNVLVSVLDAKNRPAADLPIDDFKLFEEGVEQKIAVFESETNQPLDLALMIDASLSAHKEIGFEQEAAAHFIRQILRAGDRLAVFAFDENVTQLAAFSDNVPSLQSAVRRIPPGAGTSIYDAVVLGAKALGHRGEERRRVIILVTDAGETTSRADFDAARKEALRSGTLLYTIVIRPIKNESGRNTAGEHALETITDTTGGAMFFPDSAQDLTTIFDLIDRELRTQYRLGYYPTPRGPANSYRNIEVKVLDGSYRARHRKTYLTGQQ